VRPADYFDELYRTHDRYWWRDQERYSSNPNDYPQSLLAQQTLRVLAGRPLGRVLDLGAGEGSDAIRLARLGYLVDAVEVSPVAAAKIATFACQAGVQVNVAVADVASFVPDGMYDVVISNGVLHYIADKEAAISRMQKATTLGGINVLSLWSTFSAVPDCHDVIPAYCDDEDGIVKKLYCDWQTEFIYFDRKKLEMSHSDMPEHAHSHIKLIARKLA
jgi:SAM-dependent methyltransferase